MLGPRLATGLSALRPALLTSALLLMARTIFDYVGNDLGIIKSLRPFPHDAATDEAFKRTEFAVVLGRDKADGVANRVRTSGAADAMDIILGVHREIIIHDVRNAVHVNAARGDVCRHEHPHGTGFEIFQRLEPLVL